MIVKNLRNVPLQICVIQREPLGELACWKGRNLSTWAGTNRTRNKWLNYRTQVNTRLKKSRRCAGVEVGGNSGEGVDRNRTTGKRRKRHSGERAEASVKHGTNTVNTEWKQWYRQSREQIRRANSKLKGGQGSEGHEEEKRKKCTSFDFFFKKIQSQLEVLHCLYWCDNTRKKKNQAVKVMILEQKNNMFYKKLQ